MGFFNSFAFLPALIILSTQSSLNVPMLITNEEEIEIISSTSSNE